MPATHLTMCWDRATQVILAALASAEHCVEEASLLQGVSQAKLQDIRAALRRLAGAGESTMSQVRGLIILRERYNVEFFPTKSRSTGMVLGVRCALFQRRQPTMVHQDSACRMPNAQSLQVPKRLKMLYILCF